MSAADCTPGREPRSVAASFIYITVAEYNNNTETIQCSFSSVTSCRFDTEGLHTAVGFVGLGPAFGGSARVVKKLTHVRFCILHYDYGDRK